MNALELADWLENIDVGRRDAKNRGKVCRELRRLHEAYECNTAIMHARTKRMNELHAINAELVEALDVLISRTKHLKPCEATLGMVEKTLKKAKQ